MTVLMLDDTLQEMEWSVQNAEHTNRYIAKYDRGTQAHSDAP